MMVYLYMTTPLWLCDLGWDFNTNFIGPLYIVSSDVKSYAVLLDYHIFYVMQNLISFIGLPHILSSDVKS